MEDTPPEVVIEETPPTKDAPKVKKLSRNMVLMRSRGDSIDQVRKLNLW